MSNEVNGNAERARVIVVEGSELVRRGICDVLLRYGEPLEIAAEVVDAGALSEACQVATPDVIVMSLSNDGELRALRQALESRPATRAIVLLDHVAAGDVIEVVHAGASAVLLRDVSSGTLLDALRDVLAGGCAIDAQLARCLFDRLATNGGNGSVDLESAVAQALSRREREVLRVLAQGYRNKEISAQLGVSVGTVKTHLRHIFRKLHVADRTAAVLVALQGRAAKAA
jgi:DNA-binding NarL/FixJ family response regulator